MLITRRNTLQGLALLPLPLLGLKPPEDGKVYFFRERATPGYKPVPCSCCNKVVAYVRTDCMVTEGDGFCKDHNLSSKPCLMHFHFDTNNKPCAWFPEGDFTQTV